MKNYIIIVLSLLALNANANEKDKEKELNVLYSADSTRITPRSVTAVLNNMGQTTSTYYRHNTYSMPLVKSYSCIAYRGQYDIDNKAEGTFYITTENNPNLPNYRQIISTDNSQCVQPCYPTDTKSYATCSSVHGSGWTGDITYNTYSYCTKGGYLKAEPPMPIYDNCAPPPPPPVIVSPPIVDNPPITNEPPKLDCSKVAWVQSSFAANKTAEQRACYLEWEGSQNEPQGCETTLGYVSYGSIKTACEIWGYAGVYPSGENYKCTVNGWAKNKIGNSQYMNYCE